MIKDETQRPKATSGLITPPRTPFLYVAIVVLVVLPTIGLLVMSPGTWSGLWCEKIEMSSYEKAFGFRLGPFTVPREEGGTYDVKGFAWIDSGSPLAMAGLREGDVPLMRHGLGQLCTALAEVSAGGSSTLRVANLKDAGKREIVWRDVVLRLAIVQDRSYLR